MPARSRVLCAAMILAATTAHAAPPVMHYRAEFDRDGNHIADALDRVLAEKRSSNIVFGDSVQVIVTLMEAPTKAHLNMFSSLGGQLRYVYQHALYGFAGTLPRAAVRRLALGLGHALCMVEPDGIAEQGMNRSIARIRVRPLVWSTYGLEGDPGTTIGIIDTGVDTTHSDLVGRMVNWMDYVGPQDYPDPGQHGTSCISLATGTGASLGNVPVATIYHEFAGTFPRTGYSVRSMKPDGVQPWTYDIQWSGSGSITWGTGPRIGGPTESTTSGAQPFSASHSLTVAGDHRYLLDGSGASGTYSGVMTYPYLGWDDGYNLFRGVAPRCKIASARISVDGTADLGTFGAAIDYFRSVATTYNVKVVNVSFGWTPGGASGLDDAANNLMEAGTIMCGIAHNNFPGYIGNPGAASQIITVGAINDRGQVTAFSAAGAPGSGKPDIMAPGGTSSSLFATDWDTGAELLTADSNAPSIAESVPNNYRPGSGTSFAAPQVAGVVALVIEAMETYEGHVWGYTAAEALGVKTVLLATATETNQPREGGTGTDPVLDRGARDNVEGFGQVNADAAVEAIINNLGAGADSTVVIDFAEGEYGRRAWATGFRVCSPAEPREVTLDVPSTADLDLFVYPVQGDGTGSPVIVASSVNPTPGEDESVTVPAGEGCSDYILVAKKVSGYGVATLHVPVITTGVAPSKTRVEGITAVFPSPSREDVEIAFALLGRGQVALEIFDVSGRLVRSLERNTLPAGDHTVRWNGRDRTGHDSGAGMFFARLTVDGRAHTRRLVRIR